MKKWCGDRAYKVVWEPLLKVSLVIDIRIFRWPGCGPRIHTRANSSENGKEFFGIYGGGGFQLIIDELEKG